MAGELYGQAGALAYEIPQRFGLPPERAVGRQAAAPVEEQGPTLAPADIGDRLLAEREKLTDDYYNNYGTLDAYTKEMARLGINAHQPDYSQPGGGEAFKTFERMKANYYHAANALAVERENEKVMRQAEIENKVRMNEGVDQTGFYAGDMNNYQQLAVDPVIAELNERSDKDYLNQAEIDKATEVNYQPMMNALMAEKNALVAAGRDTQDVDRRIKSLYKPVRESANLRVAGLNATSRAAATAKKNEYDVNVFKDWVKVGSGDINPDKLERRTDPEFGMVSVYNGKKGTPAGSAPDMKGIVRDRVIKDVIIVDGPPKRVFLTFENPEMPKQEITDAQELAQMAMTDVSYAKALAQYDDEGNVDTSGKVYMDVIHDENTPKWEQKRLEQLGTGVAEVKQKVAADTQILNDLKSRWYNDEEHEFETPLGKAIVEKRSDGKYNILNYKKLWPSADGSEGFRNITAEDVIKKLHTLDKYESTAPSTTPTSPTADELKAAELLKKYAPK